MCACVTEVGRGGKGRAVQGAGGIYAGVAAPAASCLTSERLTALSGRRLHAALSPGRDEQPGARQPRADAAGCLCPLSRVAAAGLCEIISRAWMVVVVLGRGEEDTG